jgi:hypothetical protein
MTLVAVAVVVKGTINMNLLAPLPATLVAISLVACGGGSPSTNTPAPGGGGGQTATYPANSPEQGAYTRLAAARSTCGFAHPVQSTAVDKTTQSHVDYQLLSNTINEYEDGVMFPASFTGTYLNQRLIDVGVTPTASALLGYTANGTANTGAAAGTQAATAMLQDPDQLPKLLGGYGLQGISIRHTSQLPTWVSTYQQPARSLANITLANTAAKPALDVTGFASYPCGGETDAAFVSRGKGQPIYLAIPRGRQLDVSATIKRVLSDGTLGPSISMSKKACVLVPASGGNPAYVDMVGAAPLLCHQAMFTSVPLGANASYEVSITGFNRSNLLSPVASDIAINKTFRFTTNGAVLNF